MLNRTFQTNRRGNTNEFNIENRLAICMQCAIYNRGRCDSSLWINPNTNETSDHAKIGYIRGCNCYINVKARNPNNHCVAGKW